LRGKGAADLTRAAEDRFVDDRRRDDLIVENDRETLRLRRVGLGHVGELARADAVEAEIDGRFAGTLVESVAGVDQAVARHHDALLDHDSLRDGLGILVLDRQDFVADGRDAAGGRAGAVGGFIDQLEGHLGGLAERVLEVLRILEARHLHENAVVALTLDRRLARAERVDAAADDFDRLVDDLRLGLRLVLVGDLHRISSLTIVGELIGLAADSQHARAHGRVQPLDERSGVVALGRILDLDGEGVAVDADIVVADVRLAQGAADIAHQRFELVLLHRVEFDFEQEIRSALKVQPERDGLARQPSGNARANVVRQRVRNRDEQSRQQNERDEQPCPSRDLQHRRSALVRLRIDRLALGPHLGERRLHHLDLHIVGDLYRHFRIILRRRLGDSANQAAGRHDGIAAAQIVDGRAMFFLLLLLRAHHQEVEDQPDRDEHKQGVCQNILHAGSGRRWWRRNWRGVSGANITVRFPFATMEKQGFR